MMSVAQAFAIILAVLKYLWNVIRRRARFRFLFLVLGVHKFDLIDFYCSIGLPYLHQSIDDIEAELADMHGLEGAEA